MHHHRSPKLSLLVAALFLVVGVVSVQDAWAASPTKTCIKDNCKTPKKDCLKTFVGESKTAKADCKDNKILGLADCTDKQCRKIVSGIFKQCKKDAKTTLKIKKGACNNGFKKCKGECKNGDPNPTIGICGDGIKVPTEPCDDRGESATCDADCSLVECGDGVMNATAGEECDDGNVEDGDGRRDFCDSNCTETRCGNGILTKGEFCDPGDSPLQPSPDCAADRVCDDECECIPLPGCGNGFYEPDNGEQCDPPGLKGLCDAGYICDDECLCLEVPCGNGVIQPDLGEECDPPGSTVGCDAAADEVCNSNCVCESCPCCAAGYTYIESTVVVAEGECGVLKNFRCSNRNTNACEGDADCDFGSCYITPPFCSGNFDISCTKNSDCAGTCGEVLKGNLPLDLKCGGLYTGGGLNSVPLPFAIPDRNKVLLKIESCDAQTQNIELGAVSLSEADKLSCSEGRKCSDDGTPCVLDSDCNSNDCEDRCLFGAPLPVPNATTPATSVCSVNVVAEDASGSGTCLGDSEVTAPLRSVIYLNGDLFKASTPPDIPGVQPCPLCDTLCVGGTKADFPCDGDGDCPGGTCNTATECLGGPKDGQPCTPATSDSATLGDPEGAYPTSHDCPNDALASITDNIGGLPIDFSMTTGNRERHAKDRPNGRRNFCGYCRDVLGAGQLCFEGDTNPSCPAAIPAADGNAVPCTSDADCQADGDEYESCVQRNPGAFSEAGATYVSLTGEPTGCLADGTPRRGTMVGLFCIPPTFDATVDAAGDLPGPGAVSLQGDTLMR